MHLLMLASMCAVGASTEQLKDVFQIRSSNFLPHEALAMLGGGGNGEPDQQHLLPVSALPRSAFLTCIHHRR